MIDLEKRRASDCLRMASKEQFSSVTEEDLDKIKIDSQGGN